MRIKNLTKQTMTHMAKKARDGVEWVQETLAPWFFRFDWLEVASPLRKTVEPDRCGLDIDLGILFGWINQEIDTKKIPIDFEAYPHENGTDMTVRAGWVQAGATGLIMASDDYPLDTDVYVYVQMTYTIATGVYAITAGLQDAAAEPTKYAIASDVETYNVLLCSIISGEIHQYHDGRVFWASRMAYTALEDGMVDVDAATNELALNIENSQTQTPACTDIIAVQVPTGTATPNLPYSITLSDFFLYFIDTSQVTINDGDTLQLAFDTSTCKLSLDVNGTAANNYLYIECDNTTEIVFDEYKGAAIALDDCTKWYYDSRTADSTTGPHTIVDTADDCDNLVVDTIPASDDFSGTGTNSGSISDGNFTCRWPGDGTGGWAGAIISGSSSISSGALNIVANSGGASNGYGADSGGGLAHSGDFTLTASYSNFSRTTSGSLWAGLFVKIGSSWYGIDRFSASYADVFTDSGTVSAGVGSNTSGSMKITRVSNTVTTYYDIGSGWVQVKAQACSGSLSDVGLRSLSASSSDNADVDFDGVTIVDGSSNDIPICCEA